jgi:DNA topoisomerase I
MKLVIVESPTKAKTLSRFLGSDYVIQASMGHVSDLPKSKLGVDVDNNFEPVYELSKGKSEVVRKLKSQAKEASEIYLATDPDREGEAIAWHVAKLLTAKKKVKNAVTQFKRVTFHEITKSAIETALAKPGEINQHLVDAQQARRVVDRLVGYTLSPVLWKKVRRGLSAGRVQSVALRLMVEREQEIRAFKAQEYWALAVQLMPDEKTEGPRAFWVELVEVDGKKVEIRSDNTTEGKAGKQLIYLDSKTVVEPIETDLKKAAYTVEKIEKKERVSRPYAPFTTSTLQQAAGNVLGWSGKQTMMIAQNLYEAGFITYHRTDSLSLAGEAVESTRAFIRETFGATMLPEQPVLYKTKSKNAQEAHEAIRPTDVAAGYSLQTTGFETSGLTDQHRKLYQLIWRRMVACQMKPAVFDQTTVTVTATGSTSYAPTYRLRTTGSVMKFEGWKKLYPARVAVPVPGAETTEEVELPELSEQDKLTFMKLTSEKKETQPPPRFNDASLVKELEKRGIGRPSTYASIISTIMTRGYVERREKRFYPSVLGETVTEFLVKHFPVILDYQFTAEMEEDLDRIARAEKEWQNVMKAFYGPFKKSITEVEDTAERMKVPVEETGEACPDCKEGSLVIRSGRFGKFISCSRFPECKYTAKLTQKLEDFPCPECGQDVVLKRTKRGRSFWGCSTYPKCDYASWKDPRTQTKA